MSNSFDTLRAAACFIDNGMDRVGTGYFVGDSIVATCEHVIRGSAKGDIVSLRFPSAERTATVETIDAESDAAILKLTEPVGLDPLPLAGACLRTATWDGYGYPGLARGAAVPLQGTVTDPNGADTKGRPSLILFSPQVAAGMASKVHGFSGSPIVVEGFVVGHLKRILSDDEETGRAAYGYVWATPSATVLSMLGRKPQDAVRVAAEPEKPLRVPEIKGSEFHTYVSHSAAGRRWALLLADALAQSGFAPAFEQPPGALHLSKTAIILIDRAWLDSRRCQDEAAQLLRTGRRLIPVLLEPVELPDEWNQHLVIDCRGALLPEGSRLDRILYSVAGLTPPASAQSDELASAGAQAASVNSECAELWRSVESLINMGQPQKALALLPVAPVQLRTRQLRALALAKTGAIEGALEILERLRDEGHHDPETLGLLAGRYRQQWEKTKTKRHFIAALETYRQTWNATSDPYPGVNAAAMLIWDGKESEAAALAAEVSITAKVKEPQSPSQWGLATRAECALIRRDFTEAARLYRDAVARNPANVQALAAMHRNARRTLQKFPGVQFDLDALLPVPRPVAFVGHCMDRPGRPSPRFPEQAENRVRRAIQAELDRLEADFGVSSASDGADILFVESLLARGGIARIVLPCPRGQFAREFVAPEWVHRFRRILAAEHVEIIEIKDGDPQDLWADFRPVLKQEVESLARQLDHTPLLITVWDGKPGYVQGTVDDWCEMGWPFSHLSVLAADASNAVT